jgi:hypothetical protein
VSLRLVGCQLLLVNGQLATDAACCCTPPCTGPCDEWGLCGPDCVCVDGECIAQECVGCRGPTEWRITDGDGNVFASGPGLTGLYWGIGEFPPVTPTHYWTTGLQEWKLEIYGCTEAWVTLESWEWDIDPCEGRYPEHFLAASWPPPEGCDCAILLSTEEFIDPCLPCPDLEPDPGLIDGMPPGLNGPARRFTGLINGDWTNLLNWEDADGLAPAGALPNHTDDVVIAADVTSFFGGGNIWPSYGEARALVILAGATVSIPIVATSLECYGVVGDASDCPDVFGHITVSGASEFIGDDAGLEGEVTAPLTVFRGGFVVGQVNGDAEFRNAVSNFGTVTGNATFNDSAFNGNAVTGNATFNDGSYNAGTVTGNATFNDSSFNGGTVTGNATFNDNSEGFDGIVGGTITDNR